MGYTVNGHSVWFILLITFLTSFLLVPFVKKLAFHIDAVDYPNQRRINKVPMPDLGGLAVFFSFLFESNPYFHKFEDITEIALSDLELLQPVDIEEYLEYLKYYKDADGTIKTNKERGLHRKLATLRSFFNYYYKRELIKNNPTVIVDMPKLHKREIVRLDADEVANLLDYVEHGGDELTGMKKVYFEKNKTRNLALFTLLHE